MNAIRVDDEHSQSLIKGVTLGTIMPGETALKTLYLKNTGGVGDRVLDISVQSRSPVVQDTSEMLHTLSVPTVTPMKVEYDVKYIHARGPLPGLTDLDSYECNYWDDGEGGEAFVKARMACMGPWGVSVETVRLVRKVSLLRPVVCHGSIDFTSKNGPHARVLECSLDEDEDDVTSGTLINFLPLVFYLWFPEWLPGDEFAAVCRISLSLEDEPGEDHVVSGPGEYELSWRRYATHLLVYTS